MKIVNKFNDLIDIVTPLALQSQKSPTLILIGGCSRVGKTFLVKKIAAALLAKDFPSLRLPLDCWLVDWRNRSPLSTVMERFEVPGIVAGVKKILKGEEIFPPVYDPLTRTRVSPQSLEGLKLASGLLLVDGVIALGLGELLDLARLKIFVSVDKVTRLTRLKQFYENEKGLKKEATSIIEKREQEEVPFILETQKKADLVFVGENIK